MRTKLSRSLIRALAVASALCCCLAPSLFAVSCRPAGGGKRPAAGKPGAARSQGPVSVSGTIFPSDKGHLPPIKLSLEPSFIEGESGSDGSYVLKDVANGDYRLIPSKDKFEFIPQMRAVSVNFSSVGHQDFLAVRSGLANAPWPKHRGNSRNTGFSTYIGPHKKKLKWIMRIFAHLESSPILGPDGMLYMGAADRRIYQVDADTKEIKNSFKMTDRASTSPAIAADGSIYVGCADGSVFAVGGDGWTKWTFDAGQDLFASPAVGADGTVYIATYSTSNKCRVIALNPANGNAKWSHTLPLGVMGTPALGADGTVYVGCGDGKLYALSRTSGATKWTYQTVNEILAAPAVGDDGTIYIGSKDYSVYAISSDGNLKWSTATGNWVTSSCSIGPDGTVYVGSNDRKLYALDPKTGAVKWATLFKNQVRTPSVDADGMIYVGCADGSINAVEPRRGRVRWTMRTAGDVFYVTIGPNHSLYAVSSDENTYCISG